MCQRRSWSASAFSLCLAVPLVALAAPSQGKIPITTSFEEARQLYLKGRDANEKLRGVEAYALFEKAAAKDPSFALAYYGMANSANANLEFFAALRKAVALSDKVSVGERLMIEALNAGVKGDNDGQRKKLTELAETYPNDERALTLLGVFYFGNQDYPMAIKYLTQATAISPNFTPPYNQLGYAYRFQGKYPEAEKTFQKYIELLPGDPNPYDSYGELLMKMGRFDDSIASYRKALKVDPHFTASMVGIANDQMFQSKGDEARKTLRKMYGVARNDGERRIALFWIGRSYVLEGDTQDAVRTVAEQRAIAQKSGDFAAQSGDAMLLGNILLHAEQLDGATAAFAEEITLMNKASVPAEVKEANRRNNLFDTARVALKRGDLVTAQAQAHSYQTQVEVRRIPFEVRQVHELLGMIALAQRQYDVALAELAQSSAQNPQVLYFTALALQGKGDTQGARTAAQAVANFNSLNGNYAFVRSEAQRMATGS